MQYRSMKPTLVTLLLVLVSHVCICIVWITIYATYMQVTLIVERITYRHQ